jgi:hypothetical protein
LRVAPLFAALLFLAAACSSERAAPEPSASQADEVVLHAYDVHLDPTAEKGSDEIAFFVHADGALHVVVRGPDVDICEAAATYPPCEHGKVADVNTQSVSIRATDQPVDIDEISVAYEAADRTTRLELPTIAPRPGESVCKDACNPVFEMTPFRAGKITATSRWDGIASARLLIETGGMSEHAYAERGKPYKTLASQKGSTDRGEVTLRSTVTVDGSEVGIALENRGARPLLSPSIEVEWP